MNSSPLRTILDKKVRKTIGLMSGTSADGVDIAFCEVNTATFYLRNIASSTVVYPNELKREVLSLATSGEASLQKLMVLSTYLGHFYVHAVVQFCRERTIELGSVDLVGSHGQTISHLAEPVNLFGTPCRGTMQIGEAEIIAKELGALTVSDFRAADVAVGGSGAPLAPIYHQARFPSKNGVSVVVNIGGIANITALEGQKLIIATDTGPGNCLIDTCMKELFGRDYDRDGEVAQSGSLEDGLLQRLLSHKLFKCSYPVSFDRKGLLDLLESTGAMRAAGTSERTSIVTTVTELTALTIANAIGRILPGVETVKLVLCGGGAHNRFLMSRLAALLPNARITTTAEYGSDPDFVEAEAFAYLANLCLDGMTGNVSEATNASRPAILGKISQP